MRFFNNRNYVAILRQSYTNNVSSFTTTGVTVGYLRSLDAETATANGFQYGYGFAFIAEFGVDVRPGDKLAIGYSGTTTVYTVHGVTQNAEAGNPTAYMKALITLPE